MRVLDTMKVMTWVGPALGIPALRFVNDDPAIRKELLIRDASTYTLGAGIFLATDFLARRVMTARNWFKAGGSRDLVAFGLALAANIVYAGIGAVKLSKRFGVERPSDGATSAKPVAPNALAKPAFAQQPGFASLILPVAQTLPAPQMPVAPARPRIVYDA